MKRITAPIQIWFWEMLMPLFLKRSTNPTALDWLYSYRVEWDTPVKGTADALEQPALNEARGNPL